jgi:hypothetical protein
MRNITFVVAATGAAAVMLVWSAPSRADMWNGAREKDGKCWQNVGPQGSGFWGECPKPAAAVVPARPKARRHHS